MYTKAQALPPCTEHETSVSELQTWIRPHKFNVPWCWVFDLQSDWCGIYMWEAVSNGNILCYYHKQDLFIYKLHGPRVHASSSISPAQDTKLLSLNCKHESIHINLTCPNVECSFCEVTGAAFSREKQYQMVIFYATTIKKIFYSWNGFFCCCSFLLLFPIWLMHAYYATMPNHYK